MFRKEITHPQPPQPVEQFQVLPVGNIVYRDGHYYRVHDYGLQELPQPNPLPENQ